MQTTSARVGYLHTFFLLLGSALFLCATGCFLLPMPPGADVDLAPALVPDLGPGSDPVMEDPIRPIGMDTPPAEPVEVPLEDFGDLNDDGIIDESDVDLFREEFGNVSDEDFAIAADLDNDGAVTLVDFQIFLSGFAAEE